MSEKTLSVQRKIILTAMRLFSEDGFQTGIDTIIAKAGIAKMSLYRHFPSKDHLIAETLKVSHSEMMLRIQDIVDAPVHDMKKLRAAFEEVCTLLSTDELLTRLVSKGCVDFRPGTMLHDAAVKMKYELMQKLEGLCRAAGFGSPKSTSRKLMTIADGCFVLSSATGAEEALKIAKQMGEHIFATP